ncbi:protein-glutamate O-methyltransferase CheR [Telmatospirillum sp. J64-1]|uniref:CheR family methyltransferase n=1 Tax=Telmatospirillum sp. J64-1 TaxID=2502183 RepID=UPI00163DD977|nr:CheR family methyltransferase [Telmatospirillum sp. J64-1]
MTTAEEFLQNDPSYHRLKDKVVGSTGMAFYRDRDDILCDVVMRRLLATGLRDCDAYLELLETEGGSDELDILIAELTIGETYFFRHHAQFEALEQKIIPDILRRNESIRQINVWSAGCSTGPEAYSVAILLKERFGKQLADWNIHIHGTDINRKFLALARTGRFGPWSFRAVPEEIRERWFNQVGDEWEISREIKSMVRFYPHNLVTDPPPKPENGFDLILCRNVIIYFDRATAEALVARLHESLADGGWLAMGHSEPNLALFRKFHTLSLPGAIIYRKEAGYAPPALPARTAAPPSPPPSRTRAVKTVPPKKPARQSARSALTAQKDVPPPRIPAPRPAPHLVLELAEKGDWDAAEAACDAMLRANPLDGRAYYYRALLLEQAGRFAESETALRRSVFLDRRSPLPHYQLALLLLHRQDVNGAQRSFRNALSLADRREADTPLPELPDLTAGQLREMAAQYLQRLKG